VFGTDFPQRTGIDHVKGLREAGVFTDEQVSSIERGNALNRYRGGQVDWCTHSGRDADASCLGNFIGAIKQKKRRAGCPAHLILVFYRA